MLLNAKKPTQSTKCCDYRDCRNNGEFPAPIAKQVPQSFSFLFRDGYEVEQDTLSKKYWFCLEHIREYNKSWDFFSDMNQPEIESFFDDAATGHRRVYSNHIISESEIYEKTLEFRNFNQKQKKKHPIGTDKEFTAMEILDISPPLEQKKLKAQYRKLVKKYHPDKGGKETEDRFKQINEAYNFLKSQLNKANI